MCSALLYQKVMSKQFLYCCGRNSFLQAFLKGQPLSCFFQNGYSSVNTAVSQKKDLKGTSMQCCTFFSIGDLPVKKLSIYNISPISCSTAKRKNIYIKKNMCARDLQCDPLTCLSSRQTEVVKCSWNTMQNYVISNSFPGGSDKQ